MTAEKEREMSAQIKFKNWRKPEPSGDGGCVEFATADGLVGLRDSKDPNGPVLAFPPREWEAFAQGVANGEFVLD